MADDQVPQVLRQRLEKKLNIRTRGVYKRIARIARDQMVSPRAAAFLLAGKAGVGYSQWATAADRAEMRGHVIPAVRVEDPKPTATVAKREPAPLKVKPAKTNTLFVVHGRDTKLNEDVFGLLRALGLNPIEWSKAVAKTGGNNPDVDKIIGGQMKTVQGIVVLISPDEEAKLKPKFCDPTNPSERTLQNQARPNVLFEAGWAFGAYPDKTLLVQVGRTRPISDLGGKHIMRLSNSPDSRKELAQRLKKMKFKVDTEGTSWLTEFDFER